MMITTTPTGTSTETIPAFPMNCYMQVHSVMAKSKQDLQTLHSHKTCGKGRHNWREEVSGPNGGKEKRRISLAGSASFD